MDAKCRDLMKDGPVGPTRFQIISIYDDGGDDQDIESPILQPRIVKYLVSIRLGLVAIQERV